MKGEVWKCHSIEERDDEQVFVTMHRIDNGDAIVVVLPIDEVNSYAGLRVGGYYAMRFDAVANPKDRSDETSDDSMRTAPTTRKDDDF